MWTLDMCTDRRTDTQTHRQTHRHGSSWDNIFSPEMTEYENFKEATGKQKHVPRRLFQAIYCHLFGVFGSFFRRLFASL